MYWEFYGIGFKGVPVISKITSPSYNIKNIVA
jgi:hypothetical protein